LVEEEDEEAAFKAVSMSVASAVSVNHFALNRIVTAASLIASSKVCGRDNVFDGGPGAEAVVEVERIRSIRLSQAAVSHGPMSRPPSAISLWVRAAMPP
jgi:hypothetical protein